MENGSGGGIGILGGMIWLAFIILMIISMWKIFVKAGRPGWGCLIPFYNLYLMLEMSGKPAWWLVLFFIPFVNFIAAILLMLAFAKSFGKGGGFAVGLLLLGFIFFPILAFGDAKYIGPQAS
jgi:hypothetical protein